MRFIKMTPSAFRKYRELQVDTYAREFRKSKWGVIKSYKSDIRDRLDAELPKGEKTTGHVFWNIEDDKTRIGHLWIGKQGRIIYLHDWHILRGYRRQGYGKRVIQKLRGWAKQQGFEGMKLHVFAHNKVARKMYLGFGFYNTGFHMHRDLS